jgi:hypothetical protein
VPPACTVLIAPADLLPAIRERAGESDGEVLTFSDKEPLRALSVIMKRRPKVVTIERLYAATSRGAALINRIKADPKLANSEIRIIAHNSDYMRISPRKPAAVTEPLDQRGTRRAQRFKVSAGSIVRVDGNAGTPVDLSSVGAQIVTTGILKPGQRVRIGLEDALGVLEFNATVCWASFEIPPDSRPRYRAGFDFLDADGPAIEAYCNRNKP